MTAEDLYQMMLTENFEAILRIGDIPVGTMVNVLCRHEDVDRIRDFLQQHCPIGVGVGYHIIPTQMHFRGLVAIFGNTPGYMMSDQEKAVKAIARDEAINGPS